MRRVYVSDYQFTCRVCGGRFDPGRYPDRPLFDGCSCTEPMPGCCYICNAPTARLDRFAACDDPDHAERAAAASSYRKRDG